MPRNQPLTSTLAALACVGIGTMSAFAATEERLTKAELLKLNACMAMTSDRLTADSQCGAVMKKASLTSADIEKMRRCESKVNVEVLKDPDCAAMIKKHPDLVRGHGSLMPEDASKPAPSPK